MTTWKIRHEGSPKSIEGLTANQVVQGLQDGLWDPTDEVQGPKDTRWLAIENHPQFAEVAADIEPPAPIQHDLETHLDMNPLIDVCLVLLIFFMLTTSYAALQKVLDMPGLQRKNDKGPLVVTKEQLEKVTIRVDARLENGKPVVRVEGKVVDPNFIMAELVRWVKDTRKNELVLDADDGVSWDLIVKIQDAAKGAKFQKIHFPMKPGEKL